MCSASVAWALTKGDPLAACALAPCLAVQLHYISHVLLVYLLLISVEMEAFNQLLLEYPELMYSGVGATAVVAGGALIYKIATR